MKKLPTERGNNGTYHWQMSPFRWIETLSPVEQKRLMTDRILDNPERLEGLSSVHTTGILS